MVTEAPEAAEALDGVEAADIVVVTGEYDHVELVLDALQLPYTAIATSDVATVDLKPEQLLVVNCPGNIGAGGVAVVRRFVDNGGSLFTTDWALRNVVQTAFPGVIAYNECPTRDDVVRMEVVDSTNPFLTGVMDGADDPVWWLEASSFPIRVLDGERVKVLLSSREMGDRYGEAALAVQFNSGEGEVFHMVSHYYLQRTELRTARHRNAGVAYAAEKGVALDDAARRDMADLSLGAVESAATSARWLANVVADKKRKGR